MVRAVKYISNICWHGTYLLRQRVQWLQFQEHGAAPRWTLRFEPAKYYFQESGFLWGIVSQPLSTDWVVYDIDGHFEKCVTRDMTMKSTVLIKEVIFRVNFRLISFSAVKLRFVSSLHFFFSICAAAKERNASLITRKSFPMDQRTKCPRQMEENKNESCKIRTNNPQCYEPACAVKLSSIRKYVCTIPQNKELCERTQTDPSSMFIQSAQ